MDVTFSATVSRKLGIVAVVSGTDRYDLVVIGGGSAGLTAADFAARIGAKILIAAEQLGGDCTWTGCIPSKALIRIARLAHDQLHSVCSGVGTGEVRVDFSRVMAEVRAVIARVYSNEAPEVLAKRGIEVALGPVRFRRRREPPGRRPSRRRKELAGESINELALAIDRGLSVSDVASTIHAYPTFGFAIQQLAAEAAFAAAATGIRGRAIHAVRRLP